MYTMKRFLLIVCLATIFYACNEEPKLPPNTYQITINAPGVYNGIRAHINIIDERNRPIAIDTGMFIKGQAVLNGEVKNPVLRTLSINGIQGSLQFVLEPGITTIDFNEENAYYSTITGGENNKLYDLYKAEIQRLEDEFQAIRKKAAELRNTPGAGDEYATTVEKGRQIRRDMEDYAHTFIEEHPDSDFSLLLLDAKLGSRNLNLETLKKNFATLEDVMNRNPGNKLIGQKIQTYILRQEALANLEIGKIAPNFTSTTPEDKELSLNEVKGKATIIEFWASWCGPCRKENPNIVRVYEKYHDKGLEIIGVSLDRENQRQRWLDAIETDGLNWHHVSSLKYFNDPVARLYNVSAIPASFILDEDGRIVAKKLRGQALENQISSMLD